MYTVGRQNRDLQRASDSERLVAAVQWLEWRHSWTHMSLRRWSSYLISCHLAW